MKKSVSDLQRLKQSSKIVMLTAYDYPSARIADECGIDILLVGDSVGTNVLGYADVTEVTMQDMMHHVRAVGRAANQSFVLADLPFHSYETPRKALENAALLIGCGADGVKIEGETEVVDAIRMLSRHGIPVCAHIGYTPQKSTGKPSVQGKDARRAQELMLSALSLQQAGAFLIVLELITQQAAGAITQTLTIPTIGIGAGSLCNGQVLVMHDMIGMSEKTFKHVKAFSRAREHLRQSIDAYGREVRQATFPDSAKASTMPADEFSKFKHWLDEGGASPFDLTPCIPSP